ncbi:saccharopine dehydrogenase NADP-binding domain-containing protein [Streptomyces yaizuensis]|uniref:Saccharopine dehydrogenase NADP-binding domain-containing protein n=2 Tax=Streptomyces yaizuensis TaxID=2989713 RepID=A0ABQ5NQJ4_9ACTN|nr:saccharopine dehydrogenase NADP-binding domain-containing protein [Streptomyces sp. YSPA8]
MSTGSGLALLCEGTSVVLWGRTVAKAEACLARLGLTGRAAAGAYTPGALAAELAPGDIVVSMLPATEHPPLIDLALAHRAHFACSSYAGPAIEARAGAARRRGSVLLTELGLDPGIDHLLAHELVRKARQVTGERPATAHFTSYCGSNPAVPNAFRYRFSWAPRGVLTALLTPARLIEDGAERAVARPWEAVTTQVVGGETVEVYPNRDSVPFVLAYGFPATWHLGTFVRGTLRLAGWSEAWRPVLDELPGATDARLTELADELAARYPTTAADHDRVVMSVKLRVHTGAGESWWGEYVLDMTGDARESATARLVSTPLACGVLDIATGRTPPGPHRATDDPRTVARWLDFLRVQSITASYAEGAGT